MAVYEGARPRTIALPRRPRTTTRPSLERRRVRAAFRAGRRTNRLGIVLGAIVVAVELLNRIGGPEGAKQRGVIERQSRHLARLVDDLLDVARVTSGKVVLQKGPLDLDDLIRRCLQAVEPSARAGNRDLSRWPAGPASRRPAGR